MGESDIPTIAGIVELDYGNVSKPRIEGDKISLPKPPHFLSNGRQFVCRVDETRSGSGAVRATTVRDYGSYSGFSKVEDSEGSELTMRDYESTTSHYWYGGTDRDNKPFLEYCGEFDILSEVRSNEVGFLKRRGK